MALTQFSEENPIKVMVVDDSAVIRGFLNKTIGTCTDIKVASVAANGLTAINNLVKERHDVILLDVEMPTMDGLTAIPRLLQTQPDTKIIMVSTLTTENAETTMRALALGAVECIAKPRTSEDIFGKDIFRDTLIHTIREIVGAKIPTSSSAANRKSSSPLPQKQSAVTQSTSAPPVTVPSPQSKTGSSLSSSVQQPAPPIDRREGGVSGTRLHPNAQSKTVQLRPASEGFMGKPDVLAIGSSTGGPNALFKLFSSLRGVDVPIILTQHMPPTFTRILAEHIKQQTGLSAVEAENGMPLVAGRVHVAPGGFHMLIDRKGATPIVKIDDGEMENFCRPAVDPMLRSAVKVFGNRIMAVILTGMGQDGMLGCRDVVKAGGRVIAQDEASSVVWGMPGATALDGSCSAVLPLDEIGPWLRKSSLRLP